MHVRLANDWTGPDHVRHRAGDFVEVDNVTLAELEAGGYVSTEEEGPRPGDSPDPEPEQTIDPQPTDGTEEKQDDQKPGGTRPESENWPPIS
jgi:hypothetical protein